MNVLLWLQIPWCSPRQSLRWITILVIVATPLGLLGINSFLAGNPASWQLGVGLCGVALFFLWAFFLPATLLLAIDARQLRLPGVERQIVGSLLLYGVLSLAVPTAWLVTRGATALPVAAALTLACCGGLAFATVPRYLVVLFAFTPSLFIGALRSFRIRLPDAGDLPLISLAGILALVLLLIVVWRARRLLQGGTNQPQGWSAPIVLQLRDGSWDRRNDENRSLRLLPDWLRADVDLADVGPARPGKSLRVALGGWYLPQTWRSYARHLALGIVALSLLVLLVKLLAWLNSRPGGSSELTRGLLVAALAGLAC